MRVSGLMYLLEQLHCALWLLLALGLAAGQMRPAPLRLPCTALFLGALTLACALLPFPWLRFAALALSAVLAPQAAWPGLPRSSLLRLRVTCAALLLASAGSARLLAGMGLSGAPLALLLPMPCLLFACLLPRCGRARCVSVEVSAGHGRLRLTALVDSGNLLRDPVTGLPVIVMSRNAASRLVPLPGEDSLPPGMRLISVRTVAGPSLMAVFRPEQVRVLLPGGWRGARAVIGLSPDGYEGFQALLPASLLPDESFKGGMPV